MPLSQVCGFLVKLKMFILLQTLVLMEMSMSSPEWGHVLFPIDEVLDDVADADIRASDETKEADKEESNIFGSPDSET